LAHRRRGFGREEEGAGRRLLIDDQVEQDLDITLVAFFDEFETVVERPVRRVNVPVVRDVVPLNTRTVETVQKRTSDRVQAGK
jgi:hypothetical protein